LNTRLDYLKEKIIGEKNIVIDKIVYKFFAGIDVLSNLIGKLFTPKKKKDVK
jgi:hypothetical protein